MKKILIIAYMMVAAVALQAQDKSLSEKIQEVLLINDPDSTRYFNLVDDVIDLARQQGANHEAAVAYYSRVTYLADKYTAEAAMPHLINMQSFTEEIGSENQLLYDAWFNLINNYQATGNVVAATAALQDMLEYADSHANDYGKAIAYLMFGLLYEYSYDKATENLNKSLEYFKDANALEVGYPRYYYYMAKAAFNSNKYMQAADYARKMLSTAQTEDQTQRAYCLRLRACLEMGDMIETERCYKYLEKDWKEYKIVGPAERDAIYAMGLYLCSAGKPNEAIDMLRFIPEQYQGDRLSLQILYFSATNNYKEAFEIQQDLQQLTKSQMGSQQSSDVASANALLNNQTLEREKLQLEISNKSKTMTLAVVAIIALLVIVGVVLILLRTIKKNNSKFKIERDRVEEERKKAVKLNEMKDLFIHNMSHEMRTPLNSIIGFNELLNNSGESIDPKKRQSMLQHINMHATNLTNMLNHATILNRIDCNDAQPKITDINVSKLIKGIVEETKPKLKKDVEIVGADAIVGDIFVKADSEFLAIAVREVLDNAAKFTQAGVIRIWVKKSSTGKINIMVKDSGPGISEEKAEIIFNRFEKAGNFENGFGLGLSCAREALSLMDAEIYVDSTLAGGATFVISLKG